jgi:transposase
MADESDERMFDVPAAEPLAEAASRTPVDKTFRPYDPDQMFLMPPSISDWVPEDHLARFVSELVEETVDLEPFLASYTEGRGFPPYDPRLMLKLLIYGYVTGVRSSRKIEKACHDDVAFRFLAANAAPDQRSIARFRRRHLDALKGLFLQSLLLCRQAGMVRLGRVALDGTKVRANASRRKAMSYKRMNEREADLTRQIDEILAEAEATDTTEDQQFGPDGRDDDLPGELARRESRLAKIRTAKADLEAEAAERAAAKAEARARKRGEDEADAAQAGADAAADAVPEDKAQRNFTDPDSRIMKTSDNSFHQCYNAQAVVDDAHQVIIATRVGNSSADCPTFAAMVNETIANCGTAPAQVLADAGYFSDTNVAAAAEAGVDAFIATGRMKHGETPAPAPRGRIPKNATPKQRMTRKLRTRPGKAVYARRKAIVEPVFGQIDTCHGGKKVLLRGLDAADAEWALLAACHNLRKLFNHTGASGLTGLATS